MFFFKSHKMIVSIRFIYKKTKFFFYYSCSKHRLFEHQYYINNLFDILRFKICTLN